MPGQRKALPAPSRFVRSSIFCGHTKVAWGVGLPKRRRDHQKDPVDSLALANVLWVSRHFGAPVVLPINRDKLREGSLRLSEPR